MSTEIRTGSLRDSRKVGAVNSREPMTKQLSLHRNSNHSRESGRKHSSTSNNTPFRLQRTAVARKSSLHDSHAERYTSAQVPFRGSSQSKVVEQRHTPRESSQFSQSESSPKRPPLDRRSIHQANFRIRGTDINRPGAVDLKNGRVNDQIRRARDDNRRVEEDDKTESIMDSQTRRQAESSAGEHGRCDDFVCRPRSKSPMASDQLDSTALYRPGGHSPVAKTAQSSTKFNGSVLSNISIALANSFYSASEINSGYTPRSSQGQHTTDDQCQNPSAPIPLVLNPSRRHLSLPSSTVAHIGSNDGSLGSTIPGKLTNGNDAITPISTSAMSISSGSTPSPSFTSSSGRNLHHRKRNTCIMCKRPEVPIIDLLIRCNQCHCQYHTSCHNPKITCTKGDM